MKLIKLWTHPKFCRHSKRIIVFRNLKMVKATNVLFSSIVERKIKHKTKKQRMMWKTFACASWYCTYIYEHTERMHSVEICEKFHETKTTTLLMKWCKMSVWMDKLWTNESMQTNVVCLSVYFTLNAVENCYGVYRLFYVHYTHSLYTFPKGYWIVKQIINFTSEMAENNGELDVQVLWQ